MKHHVGTPMHGFVKSAKDFNSSLLFLINDLSVFNSC